MDGMKQGDFGGAREPLTSMDTPVGYLLVIRCSRL